MNLRSDIVHQHVTVADFYSRYGSSKIKGYGSDEHVHCCFNTHSDSTPSMNLRHRIQRIHCFGCEFDGDVINAMSMIMFGEPTGHFVEATDQLAADFGFTFPEEKECGEETELHKFYRIMKYLYNSFHDFLCGPCHEHMEYITNRGFPNGICNLYKFGACGMPQENRSFIDFLKDKFGDFPYEKYGLVDKKSHRDFPLAGRLLIPIMDDKGNVISFIGREIDNTKVDSHHPKYLYLSGYNKSTNLFLYNYNKHCPEIILVEGQLDALSLHQAGYTNAVALGGKSLSSQQELLLRGKKKILALDNDDAGRKATVKILLDYPSECFDVATYDPSFKDFNDVLMSGSSIELETISDIEFYTQYLISEYTDDRKVVDMFVDYAAKKIAACKIYDDHRKLGINIVGLDNAVSILNKNCGFEYVDIMKILNKIYEF